MKKLLCLILCLMMILPAVPSLAADSGTCGTNLTWTFSGGTLTISGSGAMEDYRFLSDWPYTTAPWADNPIKKVVIESGVTTIGESAFEGMEDISSVTIPSSVTSIGEYAFYTCRSLTELTIPSSVKNLGESAFSADTGLTSVTIQDGLPAIPGDAFGSCRSLSEVHIPVSVMSIHSVAFINCFRLAHVWYHGTEAQWDKVTKKDGLSTNAGCDVDGGLKIHCLCKVQFDANGHGKAPKAVDAWTEYPLEAPSPAPSAEGYTFTGWHREAACTNKWDFGKDTVPGDMTLYAGWKAQPDSGAGENVTNVTLKKVRISGTRSVANNKVEISWKKLSKDQRKAAKKIEIQVCANKHFSKNVITKKVSSKKTSAVISGLKRGKKYYVRIRAYTEKGGVRNVSKWSETKSFTIIKKFD